VPQFSGQDSGHYCAAALNASLSAPNLTATLLAGGLPALSASLNAAIPSMALAASLAPPELKAAYAVVLPAMQGIAASLPLLALSADVPGVTAALAALNTPAISAAFATITAFDAEVCGMVTGGGMGVGSGGGSGGGGSGGGGSGGSGGGSGGGQSDSEKGRVIHASQA